VRVHTRSPPSDPEVLGPCAGWPGQLLRPSDNSQEVKNPFDLRITRSLDPVVDQEDLVQQEGRQRHRPVVAQPGMPETFVQLEHLLEPPEERLDRPAASPVQRPPELRLVEPPPLRPVLAAPPPPVRLPPDPLPAAVEERLGFFRVSRSRKRSPGSLARVGPTSMRKPLSRPERDDCGTSQTSIRRHPPWRSAMRGYAVAPIQYRGVAMRHVGPRDAAWVPLPISTWTASSPSCPCRPDRGYQWKPANIPKHAY
jgi:hypothetical protein